MTDEALEILERRVASENRVGTVVSDVERERVAWLWPGRLAIGKITILDGDPGVGKSTLYSTLIACLTTGGAWPGIDGPGDGPDEAGSAVIVTVEDGIGDTIRPRLEEAGADLSRVTVVDTITRYDHELERDVEDIPRLPADLGFLGQAVIQSDASLLVIDPLTAHLGGDVNSFRDQDVRSALAPLAKMAENLRVSVLVVRHLNKQTGGNPLYRGGGSIGIIGAARLGMLLGHSPDDDGSLVLASTKSNLSHRPESLSLRLASSPNDATIGIIQWEGTSTHSAYDILNVKPPRSTPEQDKAAEWLRENLDDGEPHRASKMWERAESAGLAEKTVRRALKSIGVEVERIGGIAGKGAWYWTLPKTATDDDQEDAMTAKDAPNIPNMTTLGKTHSKHTFSKNGHDRLSEGDDDLPF